MAYWQDNADSWLCSECGFETNNPNSLPGGADECPHCHSRMQNKILPVHDPVNHPSHYTKGKIEVADFIADQKLNFDRGNAVKYVCRAGSKDPAKEVQDLEKAVWYINHEIKMLKGEQKDA